eukprot:GHUV01058527.1.p1 GENE.GHUV01058527.1~~GHUV01058527.1.p1  ORF type:complete len:118 (+),score=34.77 GHUV01058527.1:198-551(+)
MAMPDGIPAAPMPPGTSGLCFSTITACVVNMMPAILHEFIKPLRVTFAGSITPSSSRSVTLSVIALYPTLKGLPRTFWMITSPSTPVVTLQQQQQHILSAGKPQQLTGADMRLQHTT